jgi:5-(carboxyamino)imidazole ribonucleotide synthase
MKTTLGILGGGQLGRMSAQAAEKLGISTVIFTPEENSPASQVATETIIADYEDEQALTEFSKKVDVISYEFENIPIKTVRYLKKLKPVYPDESLLKVSQDRVEEKSFLNATGIPTARWTFPQNHTEALAKLEEWQSRSCIFKTTRFGYDGKGQARYKGDTNIETLWTGFKNTPLIMEEIVDFDCEISVIVARDKNGHMIHYGPMLNEHKNHILSKTTVPAPLDQDLLDEAVKLTQTLAEKINLRGVLTLELFVTKDGHLLANEIAPRTHNSGHWSIDACTHSQFENHVRTVCGLPAAKPQRHSDCEMLNLIGADVEKAEDYKAQPNTFVHLYGKTQIREGRKMGHVTILKPKKGP